MKNSQKGSVKVWLISIIVVLLLIGAGYIIYDKYGTNCIIAGVKYTGDGCKNFPVDTEVSQQDQLMNQAKQEAQKIVSSATQSAPSGFLVPPSTPDGYALISNPLAFTAKSATYTYKGSSGQELSYDEEIDTNPTQTYDQYLKRYNAISGADYQAKLVKTFTFNGNQGIVIMNSPASDYSYSLIYKWDGKRLTIASFGNPKFTADTLVNLLKSMTVAN